VAPNVRPAGAAAARASVRHRKRVHAIAVSALAMLVVPVTAYAALSSDPHGPPAQTAESPSHTPEPNQTGPSATPSTQASGSSSPAPPDTSATSVPAVPGRVFYLNDSGALYLGGRRYPGGSGVNALLNLNVSPDGKHVTWVDDANNLIMADLNGANRRTLHSDVDGQCVEPVWSGDGTRLLIHDRNGSPEIAVLYLAGGGGDHLGESIGCHYRWSANGNRVAVLHGDLSGVTVMNLNGSGKRVVAGALSGGRTLADLTSISPDGGRICIRTVPAGNPPGDVARSLYCDTIVDTATNKEIKLPVAGELRAAVFLPNAGMLVRVTTGGASQLVLLDACGQVLARTIESAATAKLALLSYTG